MKFTLPARKPFNFLSVINSHGWRQLAPFSYDENSNTLCYILRLSNGRVIELKLHDAIDGVIVETEKLDKIERKEVTDKVTWMFGLDMDFSLFYSASRAEPKLAHAKNVLADGARVVPEAQLSGSATLNAKAFPRPETIATSSPDVLKEKIRVGYRAPAIYELAVRVAAGKFDLEALKTSKLPTLELRKELLTINGVGPYAAANLLMLLGRHDFIPIDSYALKMVSQEWYDGKPITAKEVEKRFEKWGEFKGLAFWFWDWKDNG